LIFGFVRFEKQIITQMTVKYENLRAARAALLAGRDAQLASAINYIKGN
jgi:hypothetical protein